jgi:hypothetical protein
VSREMSVEVGVLGRERVKLEISEKAIVGGHSCDAMRCRKDSRVDAAFIVNCRAKKSSVEVH